LNIATSCQKEVRFYSFRLKDKSGNLLEMNFSEQDKTDLGHFLKTLTDKELAKDKWISDSFSR